jgi:hypothetical protein
MKPAGRSGIVVAAEWLTTALICAGVVIGPVLVGGTGPWARLMLAGIMAAASCLWALSGARSWRSLVMPLAVTALVGLQLIPLPDRLLMTLAPISGGAWKVALADVPGTWGTVSVDRGLTAASARWLLLSLFTGCAVADLARDSVKRRWMTAAVAASGVVIWVLLLAFPATGHRDLLGWWSLRGPIEWFRTSLKQPVETHAAGEWVAVEAGGQRYEVVEWGVGEGWGSYVLSNHVACALYLTVPVLVAGWLSLARSRLPDWARALLALAVFGGLFATNVWVGSRAGSAAALIAGLVFASLACEHIWARRIAAAAAVACVVGMLGLALVLYGPFSHLETLFPEAWRPQVERLLQDGRVQIAKATFRIFSAAPLLGTGLGTFGELSARLIPGREAFYYAHNDYGQLLAEAGLLGGLVAAVGGTLAWWRVRRFLPSATAIDRQMAAGPLAALAALAVHSLFDWNLHIPANAFLAIVVGAVAMALGATPRAPQASSGGRRSIASVVATIAATAALVAAVTLTARDVRSELAIRQLRDASAAAQLVKKNPASAALVREQLQAAISQAEQAARWDRWNAELPRQIAFAHVHLSQKPNDEQAEAARQEWKRVARLRAGGRPGPEALTPKP